MLYERWKQVSANRRNEIALRDFASGKSWTFAQLFAEGEKFPVVDEVIYPQGQSPEFIFQLLAAWREKKIVCPLEAGQGGASVLASRIELEELQRLAKTLTPS